MEKPDCPEDNPGGAGRNYISIGLYMDNRGTRSNPNGGQDGDGREPGHDNENRIYDLNFFFFDSDDGLNAPDDTPITNTLYIPLEGPGIDFGSDGGYQVITRPIDFAIEDGRCFITVANLGSQLTGLATLGEVRDHIIAQAWTPGSAVDGSDRFIMTTATDAGGESRVKVDAVNNGAINSPYLAETSLERTAARIDLILKDSQVDATTAGQGIPYSVTDADDDTHTELAKVHLLNILPVNLKQSGSYLLKRVTTSATADIACFNTVEYCGRETSDASQISTNYVVEPKSIEKAGDVDDATLSSWYGVTRAGGITASSFDSALPLLTFMGNGKGAVRSISDAGELNRAMTLAYTHENTQHLNQHDSRFITGLALKAVYEPATVYRYDASAVGDNQFVEDSGYAYGSTFWRYTPARQEMRERGSLYFSSYDAANAYKTGHPEDIAEIVEYPGGVCYYNVWLRHSNKNASDPHETCPMEYGIVRNNIYRAGFTFRGPGKPTPSFDLKEPSEVEFIIFVRKWLFKANSEITM